MSFERLGAGPGELLQQVAHATTRDRILIAAGGAGLKADLITMKERAAADPARRPSKALRDRADNALLRGDVPDPDEGW